MDNNLAQSAPCKTALEPIVCLKNGREIGQEMLCREKPFPENAEDWRVFYEKLFRKTAIHKSSVPTSLNLDTRHILDKSIWNHCTQFLQETAKPKNWVLEWTEHQSGDHEKAAKKLSKIARETGVALSIDDLGAGQDGLSRVCLLENPSWIKIDGKLLHQARTSSCARKIMGGVCRLGHDLEALVIAEWAETADDIRMAADMGADAGQGYFWSREKEKTLLGCV